MEAEFCIFIISKETAKLFDKNISFVSWPQEAFGPSFEWNVSMWLSFGQWNVAKYVTQAYNKNWVIPYPFLSISRLDG